MRERVKELLTARKLHAWSSRTRISGLLALLAHIAKTKSGVPVSNRLARGYCSKLRNAPAGVPREPLAVLVTIGAIEVVRPARVSRFSKCSALYRIAGILAANRKQIESTDEITGKCVRHKLANAHSRLESGLNRRWPFRERLLHDLALVTLADSARPVLDELMQDSKTRPATTGVLTGIATRRHSVKVKSTGTIITSLLSCPRALKPHLCIADEPVALCDISSAHWMFLPRLLSDRIEFCRARGDSPRKLEPMDAEFHKLVTLCSSGSFYSSMLHDGAAAEDIKRVKRIANVLLNSPENRAGRNVIWRGLHRRFPFTFDTIASIKRVDHRRISEQLQSFTASAITTALIELQAQGVPCIPDTDCLIVRARDKLAACSAIGAAMRHETRGVAITVGGIKAPDTISNANH